MTGADFCLAMSGSLLPPYVQTMSYGSATMGEGDCFTEVVVGVGVRVGVGVGRGGDAMRCFHWLSDPRVG